MRTDLHASLSESLLGLFRSQTRPAATTVATFHLRSVFDGDGARQKASATSGCGETGWRLVQVADAGCLRLIVLCKRHFVRFVIHTARLWLFTARTAPLPLSQFPVPSRSAVWNPPSPKRQIPIDSDVSTFLTCATFQTFCNFRRRLTDSHLMPMPLQASPVATRQRPVRRILITNADTGGFTLHL
jgi:hypothetical protein